MVDDLLAGPDDRQVRARPHGLNSIAWLLWHAARVGDVAIDRFVADRPQILLAGDWNRRLGIDRVDAGPGANQGRSRQAGMGPRLAPRRRTPTVVHPGPPTA